MDLFTAEDFKVFDLADFHERMGSLMSYIRPKLTSISATLAPKISPIVDSPLYVHVAKHARRTVNPPDDTWAAFGPDGRGYKKDVHFKIAISRHCVRFLFEAGPEYYAKADWERRWHRHFKQFSSGLHSAKGVMWFKNEHDETPAAALKDLSSVELKDLGNELTRRRDGQLALGRRIDAEEFVRLKPKQVEIIVGETFEPMAPLFRLHDTRTLQANRS